ncbi:Uncharacterised protein [Mycobacteroides abscessus subsp. abscessus]|nr:Uncharacterised protein [Mycobacteroides abscessus subsp. abscessus]
MQVANRAISSSTIVRDDIAGHVQRISAPAAARMTAAAVVRIGQV